MSLSQSLTKPKPELATCTESGVATRTDPPNPPPSLSLIESFSNLYLTLPKVNTRGRLGKVLRVRVRLQSTVGVQSVVHTHINDPALPSSLPLTLPVTLPLILTLSVP